MENMQKYVGIWERGDHTKQYTKLLKEYCLYQDSLCKKDSSKAWDIKHIIPFFYFLEKHKYKKITIPIIGEYIEEQINIVSIRTVYNRKIVLRLFLNWLHTNKKINFNGNMVFPVIKSVASSSIKSYYSNNEIKEVIDSMSIKTKIQKRNYAIILTFTYTGMRLEDVRTLKFSNINWNDNSIKYIQSKTNIETISIVSKELRIALLDYLKNARPKIENDFVFIKIDGQLLSQNTITEIARLTFKNSGIDLKSRKHGTHAFRHTIATNMLYNNESLEVISKTLGIDVQTATQDYIKYDEKILRKISLEVPLWK